MKKMAFISCLFNPADFNSPIDNAQNYMKFTVGKAFSAEDFYFCQVITKQCRSLEKEYIKGHYLELHSESILWHKERCFNLLARKFNLYDKYDYICWADADVIFEKHVIASDTKVFQPFNVSYRAKERSNNLGNPFSVSSTVSESVTSKKSGDKGLSWAIDSKLLKSIGGWFDYGIVGGGDTYFQNRIVGQPYSISCKSFDEELKNYSKGKEIAEDQLGYSENRVFHMFHGSFVNRQYNERIGVLRRYNFSPLDDLIVEKTGLYRLKDKYFEADIKKFFIDRDEDD